ncbi:MAG: efflux transporter outer membrane subunit, partial [Candidatus Latescibacteria bacterium]|nr:efflux transporter outer membrane subunit [Candidatus Latescibacterota bacterium]
MRLIFIAAGLVAAAVAGCGATASSHAPPIDIPDSFSKSASTDYRPAGRWWIEFGDTTLSGVIDRVLSDNLNLRQSWARMREADAIAQQADAARWPQIGVSASSGRARAIGFTGAAQEANQHSLSAAASYELDIWGRSRNNAKAAFFGAEAARLQTHAMAMTLVAQTAETWFGLIERRAQQAQLAAQIDANSTLLQLVEARFDLGLASAVEVYQQRQQLLSSQAELPRFEASEEVLKNRLALVAGCPPTDFILAIESELPQLPATPKIGLPAKVLKRRPDVEAAWMSLAAGDHLVAAAAADRYPSLRISGSTGFTSSSLSSLIDKWVWSLVGSVALPVVDGGRRKAVVQQRQAEVDERVAHLGQVMLEAITEVQDALVLEARQREYLSRLREQVAVSQSLVDQAQARYLEGLSDFLPVLNSIQTLHRAQREQISAERVLLSYRIQLYRAIGGSWTDEIAEPDAQTSQIEG